MMLDNINPKFRKWYGEQTAENQTAIQNQWDTLQTDSRVVGNWRTANYARQRFLIQWCQQNLGYSP